MFWVKIPAISVKKKFILKSRLKWYLILTGILMIGIVIFFETQIIPFENKCIEKESKSVAVKIINKSVEKILVENTITYSDISKINYSADGKVNSIETNSVIINKLKSEINNEIQRILDKDKTYYVSLSVGSFTKLNELSGVGPELKISFRLTGSSRCKIKSRFESTGVNQTVHHIILYVTAEMNTISPEYSKSINITSDYEIAQTVIVGNTPQLYADRR